MGQYYYPIILGDDRATTEHIRTYLCPGQFGGSLKLHTHSYVGSGVMKGIEYLLSPKGKYYMSRLVWAGDNALKEPGTDKNLNEMICHENNSNTTPHETEEVNYKYIINHSKRKYIVKPQPIERSPYHERIVVVHPLALLTSDGEGHDGHGYCGSNENIGTWARDVISVNDIYPDGFELLETTFHDNYN